MGALIYSRFIQQIGRIILRGNKPKRMNLAPCLGNPGNGRHSWSGKYGNSMCHYCGKFKFEVAKERRENKKLLNQYLKEQGEPPYKPQSRKQKKAQKDAFNRSFWWSVAIILFLFWVLLFW